jgi:hypothetical protein
MPSSTKTRRTKITYSAHSKPKKYRKTQQTQHKYKNRYKIENSKLNPNIRNIQYKMGDLDIISQQYVNGNKALNMDEAFKKFSGIFSKNVISQIKINKKEADVNFYVAKSDNKSHNKSHDE